MEVIKICVGGATGWAGSALSAGILEASDLELISGVSRSSAGQNLAEILHQPGSIPIFDSAMEATKLSGDVYVEYTQPAIAKGNIISALQNGYHVVVGTSGLSDEDYEEIDVVAKEANKGVLAAGNFAITAVLLQKFSEMAAKYLPSWEIIDYASASKVDAPSGTARQLAFKLGQVRKPNIDVPMDEINGPPGIRGASMQGSQVHSVRLPGYVLGVETVFGLEGEKLNIRHEAGTSATPYVKGALLAIRAVPTFIGLKRGLDTIMKF